MTSLMTSLPVGVVEWEDNVGLADVEVARVRVSKRK